MSWSVASEATGTMALRNARTPPATSTGVTSRTRKAVSSEDICTGEALPSMNMSNASSASSALRRSPSATLWRMSRRSNGGDVGGEVWGISRWCSLEEAGAEGDDYAGGFSYNSTLRASLDNSYLRSTFRAWNP